MEANRDRGVTLAELDRGESGYQSCKAATGYVPTVDIEGIRPRDAFCVFSSDLDKFGQFQFVEVKSRGSNPVLTWKVKILSDI